MEELIIYSILSLILGFAICYLALRNDSNSDSNAELRKEIREINAHSTDQLRNTLEALGSAQSKRLEDVSKNIEKLKEGNEKKLDQMREVVDEKLQSTLEKRITESFKVVGDRLEKVHKGLGEMQDLASGVGDLKKALTNVSTRGALGEVQAEKILESILSPNQFDKNVQTNPNYEGRVEFAIQLPGSDGDFDNPVWLPIDCKFLRADHERLMEASDSGDKKQIKEATKKFISIVKSKADEISKKYIFSPHTTDFAVMFLPTEGLYADVVRQRGLMQQLQNDYQIVVTGPTTLAAFVNSLQMGFRTMALESRASEVWNVLGGVKTEFNSFGKVLGKLHKQLNTAVNTVGGDGDSISRRLRAMDKQLKNVEVLPSSNLKGLPNVEDEKSEGQQKL